MTPVRNPPSAGRVDQSGMVAVAVKALGAGLNRHLTGALAAPARFHAFQRAFRNPTGQSLAEYSGRLAAY
jgi:hypothetical protein